MTYLLTIILHIDSILGLMVTVIGWLASAVILFSLIGIEVRRHREAHGQAFVYTENFFAGIISAGLYVLIALLLSIYMVSVKVSPLDPKDRRKVECTAIVLRASTLGILLLGGAAVYSTIEGWSLMDALYFADYTLLTIGIGNITPKTHLGRSLLFPYATLGIISLAFFISAVASFTDQMRDLKLKWKIEETRRPTDNADASGNTVDGHPTAEADRSQIASASRVKSEEILRARNVRAAFYRRRIWAELGFFLAAWFVLWLVSAAIFCQSEKEDKWTYFVALYFTYTSLTTIGYGDYFPTSNFGKVYFILWSLLAIPILTNLVNAIGSVFHMWLIFCSGWIWRRVLRKGRPRHHHNHEFVYRPLYASGLNATEKSPKPRPGNSDLNTDSQTPGYLGARQGSPPLQDNNTRRGSRGDGQQCWIISRRASTHYQLLLSEEIGNLISMWRGEFLEHQEELCCTWSRVIPLLQAKEDAGSLSELTPLFASAKSEHMRMGMLKDPKNEVSERNAAISWMLNLLVERLSSELRKDLSEAIECASIHN
jgi:hypothetical protein